MNIKALLTEREVELIRSRLQTISRLVADRKVREQCRMIQCTMNKAGRRKQRTQAPEPVGKPIEAEYNPITKEFIIKD